MLQGLMQDRPLLISSLIEHAAKFHPTTEIVSRTAEGPIHRTNYGEVSKRAKQLAKALTGLGVKPGDRVATLAWNGYRHMELYFGVSGMGAVLHTINPRLFGEQIAGIANHAEDLYLFFDVTFAPLVERLAPALTTVKCFVAMTDRQNMPTSVIPNLLCYEDLIGAHDSDYAWPTLDERLASSLCYTSGTTGNPKGVLYSHRSTVLHSFAACMADGLGISARSSALVVVPMFHVNAWGMPYAGAMAGAKLVLPGPALDGRSVYQLMRNEKVNIALGVPTVWLMLFKFVQSAGVDPRAELQLREVVIGGAPVPRTMIETFGETFGASVKHAWGMTETSPLGTVCSYLTKHDAWSDEQRRALQVNQGRPLFGVEMRITDDQGEVLANDGRAAGHLQLRGPWITSGYFKDEGSAAVDADGFFDTGDIASIDADGYMRITDRSKDIIKSGGEWISSIELEKAAAGHPGVAEAAVIGLPHPKWQERPLLVVVLKQDVELTRDEMLRYLADRVAKWWLPDDVAFVDQLPHTATGKLQKTALRGMFKDHALPGA